ncbi:MAG TPA: hypothetical protein VG434_05085 [Sphingomicrobium sp.]|jgi:hypothetical protein|nr:hypothetical protein [Sphingomicrobium sp.]
MIALLIAAADVPRAALDAADAANLALTQCGFATERSAHAAGLSVSAFEQKLTSDCAAEERRLRATSVRIFRARGSANPDVEAEEMIRAGRQAMVDAYRRLPEQERLLKEMERMCHEHPDACKN